MTDSLIPAKQAQKIVRWLAGILGAGAVMALPVVFGYVNNLVTQADMTTAIDERLNEHDHGRTKPLPPDRVKDPPPEGMATAIQRNKDDIASLKLQQKQAEQVQKLVADLYRWLVRQQAADAEANRAHRAESSRKAVREFDALLQEGMAPDEAARRALEVSPYR